MGGLMGGLMGGGPPKKSAPRQNNRGGSVSPARSDMEGPDGLDDLMSAMNLEPDKMPDLDNISLISGDTDRKSGITLNL
jgi:hypothetical protein